MGFPSGSVIQNLPVSAGDAGSIPGPGRSHVLRNNYWACVLEPGNWNSWAHALQQWEALAPQQRVAPRSPKLEKSPEVQRRSSAAKNEYILKKKALKKKKNQRLFPAEVHVVIPNPLLHVCCRYSERLCAHMASPTFKGICKIGSQREQLHDLTQ